MSPRIVELPAQARRTAEGPSLTREQAKALIATTVGHPLHALWIVMLYLRLRPGEVSGLTWADVDFDTAVIHVRRSPKIERGKLLVDECLKTDRSRRSLDAPPPVLEALQADGAGVLPAGRARRRSATHAWNSSTLRLDPWCTSNRAIPSMTDDFLDPRRVRSASASPPNPSSSDVTRASEWRPDQSWTIVRSMPQ